MLQLSGRRVVASGDGRPLRTQRQFILQWRAMDSLRTTFDHHAFLFWVALFVLWVLSVLWVARVSRRAARANERIDDLVGDLEGGNTAHMLVEYLDTVRRTSQDVRRVVAQHEEIMGMLPSMIRHIGLVRFSPFHDTGGDQSFTLALLDGSGDGVVLTGLHSRADSRLYAKPIEHGESAYVLTPEEREAMNRALGRSATAS
jgi:hypothetical protein